MKGGRKEGRREGSRPDSHFWREPVATTIFADLPQTYCTVPYGTTLRALSTVQVCGATVESAISLGREQEHVGSGWRDCST